MSAHTPLLTIVIPTRNRCDMAKQALQGALLALPFAHEVILSDNASSDSTPELKTQFPVAKYIRRPDTIPMAEHWNLCVEEARGIFVKVLCDDDWLIPGALEREVRELEQDPALTACASARLEVRQGKEPSLKRFSAEKSFLDAPEAVWKMLLSENILGPPSAVTFRKSSFQGFPHQYAYAADWAAWILLLDRGPVMLLPEPGVNFRLHSSNLTNAHVENGTDFVEVQSLRWECLRRMKGAQKIKGLIALSWIYPYFFARRIARYFSHGNPAEIANFLGRLASKPAPLPLL